MMHHAQKNHVGLELRKPALQVLLLCDLAQQPQMTEVVW